jgi:hypothetical protein
MELWPYAVALLLLVRKRNTRRAVRRVFVSRPKDTPTTKLDGGPAKEEVTAAAAAAASREGVSLTVEGAAGVLLPKTDCGVRAWTGQVMARPNERAPSALSKVDLCE